MGRKMQSIKKSKGLILGPVLPIVLLIFFGWQNDSYFVLACAVCSALFWLVWWRLLALTDKDHNIQIKSCKPVGYLLLIPSAGLIVAGVFAFSLPEAELLAEMGYYIVVTLSTILITLIFLQMTAAWKNKSLAGRFLRLTLWASICSPLSLVIVLSLWFFSPDEAALLGCMSAVFLGCGSLLIGINMIVVSHFGYQGTRDSIKTVKLLYRKHQLKFTQLAIMKDAFLVAAKSAISIFATSFFMFVNALYSGGMGVARFIVIAMHKQDNKKKEESYRLVGIIITISSICYVLYSVRLFFGGSTGVYDMNVALVIALYTFVEFGINIKEAIKLRGSKVLEAKAIRAIRFASTLVCFVLTQTAIMSFAAEGDNSFANALSGVVFGSLAAVVGLCVVFDSLRIRKTSHQDKP